MEHGRLREQPSIGDIVICIDTARPKGSKRLKKFIGLVLDKSVTVYKIQVVDTGKEVCWPMSAVYLWKEAK